MRFACIMTTSALLLVTACSQDMDKAKKKAKDSDKEEAAAADGSTDGEGATDGSEAADAGATDAAATDAEGKADESVPEIDGAGDAEADADGGGEAQTFDGKDLNADIRTLKDNKTKFFVSKDDGDFFDVEEVPDGICDDGSKTTLALKAESSKVDEAVLGDSNLFKAVKVNGDTVDVFFESDGTLGFIIDNTPDDEKITLSCPDGLTLEGM